MGANARGERGMAIGVILLAVILIAVICASIAVSARGKSSPKDSAKSYASAIMQEGTNLRIASQRMIGDGVVKTAAFITLDTDMQTGLYGGYSTAVWVENDSFSAPDGYYQQRAACLNTTDTPTNYVYYTVIEDDSPAMWGP